MKIKTIWHAGNITFDEKVNLALTEGYKLARREVIPDPHDLDDSIFYAEMVMLDEADKLPGDLLLVRPGVDPVALAEEIRAHCQTVTMEECQNDRCPLAAYCDAIREGKTPEEWPKPEGAKE